MRIAGPLLLVLTTACTLDGGGLGGSVGVPGTTTGATTGTSTTGAPGSSTTGLDTGTSTTASTTTTTSSADESTTTSTSTGSESSDSTGKPEVPPLDDTGLVARWFINEADMGQGPTQLLDAAPTSLDLDLDYHNVMPAFTEVAGRRALIWPGSGDGGRALFPIVGTKVQNELSGAQQVTVELVVAVDSVTNQTSRFFHIGTGNENGDLSIGASTLNEVEVRWANSTANRRFTTNLGSNRQVIHVVIDTTQPVPADRILAYRNGNPLTLAEFDGNVPVQGEGMPLQDSSSVALGNRTTGPRSFGGRLHYAAVYAVALSPPRVQNNADALGVNDDSP